MTKYIKIERNDAPGYYITTYRELPGMLEAELDDFEETDQGTQIILTVIEMDESEYERLPEFSGW